MKKISRTTITLSRRCQMRAKTTHRTAVTVLFFTIVICQMNTLFRRKKEKERPDAFCFCLFLSLSPAQPLATISTNAASQPKNWINILPASRALISTQWKVCSRAPIFPLLTMQMCETPPTKASSNPSTPK